MTRIRMGLVPGLLLVLALALAACGGGGNSEGVASLGGSDKATSTTNANSGKGNSQDKVQAARNWARCMRQHGINLPDPKITANGIEEQPPTGADQDNKPRLRAALQACERAVRPARR
jgi:ABC-type glycerol-3-phosphate transport system substrate-binding protein